MDNNKTKITLFDCFLDEINNEDLHCDIADDGKLINDICMSVENGKDSTSNMNTNLNEFNNDCDIMVKSCIL